MFENRIKLLSETVSLNGHSWGLCGQLYVRRGGVDWAILVDIVRRNDRDRSVAREFLTQIIKVFLNMSI